MIKIPNRLIPKVEAIITFFPLTYKLLSSRNVQFEKQKTSDSDDGTTIITSNKLFPQIPSWQLFNIQDEIETLKRVAARLPDQSPDTLLAIHLAEQIMYWVSIGSPPEQVWSFCKLFSETLYSTQPVLSSKSDYSFPYSVTEETPF